MKFLHKTFDKASLKDDFEQWFEGSKIVGSKGEPLVVFHGTLRTFDISKIDPLSHFGTVAAANMRTNINPRLLGLEACAAPKTIPVYLNLKNPLEIPDLTDHDFNRYREMIWILGYNKVINEDDVIKCFGKDSEHNYFEFETGKHWTQLMVECLKGHGYDGFVYRNRMEDSGSTSYIIFDSTQVRPAIPLNSALPEKSYYLSKNSMPHGPR